MPKPDIMNRGAFFPMGGVVERQHVLFSLSVSSIFRLNISFRLSKSDLFSGLNGDRERERPYTSSSRQWMSVQVLKCSHKSVNASNHLEGKRNDCTFFVTTNLQNRQLHDGYQINGMFNEPTLFT